MAGPIRFWFDFASPYAYFATGEIDRIGAEFGRQVEWRPVLLWAVFKAHGVAPPMDVPAKRAYFLRDMQRSADFFGLPYREPVKLPLSSHLAARLYHATRQESADKAAALAHRLFRAFFVERKDISDEAVLTDLAADAGISAKAAHDGMKGPTGRALLEQAVENAIAEKMIGSPYFVVDGESFFGADRVPQLRWFLAGGG
ncbi:2-hydroxychromene-2-carboxylate isomerase [Mesorhizobium microcysteis]|uniref:2-hydroxychromene-2-carboxylate isomerase n=1 Tax=Neoaquamicrobium microcysteis TaxID=2682781 RepID=A0A5D4GYC3_9HYPH|nr:2-hydroxychromene-2-carboxylate isomerase [Mesorhizobium microcysteis]TYR33408.1 2-hydroxychromene-2-carboxylate isomerase [Mesorhizobium microcysteis]